MLIVWVSFNYRMPHQLLCRLVKCAIFNFFSCCKAIVRFLSYFCHSVVIVKNKLCFCVCFMVCFMDILIKVFLKGKKCEREQLRKECMQLMCFVLLSHSTWCVYCKKVLLSTFIPIFHSYY